MLVVGAGSSGADIALNLVDKHEVWMAGRSAGSVPVALARSRIAHRVARSVPSGR